MTAHLFLQVVPFCLDVANFRQSGLEIFRASLSFLELIDKFDNVLVLFLELSPCYRQVLSSLLFALLLMPGQVLDLGFELANAHGLFAQRLNLLLVLHLVLALLFSQVFNLFRVLIAACFNRIELAGLRR